MDRRNFLRVSAAATALAGVQSFSFLARAALTPGRAKVGFIAAPAFIANEEIVPGGWEAAKDIATQMQDAGVSLLLATGDRCPQGWEGFPYPVVTTGCVDGKSKSGYAFILARLGEKPEAVPLTGLDKLKEFLKASDPGVPLAIVTDIPLLDPFSPVSGKDLLDLLSSKPEAVLVFCPGATCDARYLGSALCVATPPAAVYPGAGRLVEIEVSEAGVRAEVSLLQSRLLTTVEQLFLAEKPTGIALARLGSREGRNLSAAGGKIDGVQYGANPSLAPWPSDDSTLDLALITDIHIVLDKFVSDDDRKVYKLIGHALEKDSQDLFRDIIGQVNEGRHRIEFYDQVFGKDPRADRHFLERPVDGVLFLGDETENGKIEETEHFRDIARGLSDRLRPRAYAIPGNHDYWDAAIGANPAYRDTFCDCLSDFGLKAGRENYIVELSDWCTLIMLDSVIAGVSAMGLMQERIDWLSDQVARAKGKVLLVAGHHDFYPLSTVPPVLNSYLRGHSHFTGEKSSTRMQLHRLFAANNCVKFCLSGHMHSVVADQWPKDPGVGDPATVHLQTPCTTEYPCGYRLLRLQRDGGAVNAEYFTAYTRLWEVREKSMQATGYRLTGTRPRTLPGYQGTLAALQKQGGIWGEFSRLDPYDLAKLNVRGFKDGTANMGRGKGKLRNIYDRVSFTL